MSLYSKYFSRHLPKNRNNSLHNNNYLSEKSDVAVILSHMQSMLVFSQLAH